MVLTVLGFLAALLAAMFFLYLIIKDLLPSGGTDDIDEAVEQLTSEMTEVINEGKKKGKEYLDKSKQVIGAAERFIEDPLEVVAPDLKKMGKEAISASHEYTEKFGELLSLDLLEELIGTVDERAQEILLGGKPVYKYVITEDSDHPFQINPLIIDTAEKICTGKKTDEAKALAIFEWMVNTIKYGDSKRKRHKAGYRTSEEVFTDKQGVCGEMVVLYVVMARAVDLKANYVSVSRDYEGKDVNHACVVLMINKKNKFVDVAYKAFDILHKKYTILTDKDAVPHFKAMRDNK